MRGCARLPTGVLFTLLGCQPNVVDAVTEPPPLPDAGTPPAARPLETSLIHRYSFDGPGSEVLDEKGAAHGEAVNALLPGDGTLPLAGVNSNQYVNLPNRLISGLGDATFEAWLTWNGGGNWQRIFDFGDNTSLLEDVSGTSGVSYLFLTTETAPELPAGLPSALRVAFSIGGIGQEQICQGQEPFPIGRQAQVAVVIDQRAQSMALYQGGLPIGECPLDQPLSEINDINNWLGRSNYVADDELFGSYDEFRIYAAALSAEQIADSAAAGPEAGRD